MQKDFYSQWAGAAASLLTYAVLSLVAKALNRSEPPSPTAGHKTNKTGWLITKLTLILVVLSIFFFGVVHNNPIAALAAMGVIGITGVSLAWTVSAREQNTQNEAAV